MTARPGLSFKLEIVIHTILCIRQVYPPTTFTRRRAHGVPVYQSRHPQVCAYISELVGAIARELELGKVKRVTIVIKTVDTGLPLERFIVDMGYLAMDKVKERHRREAPLLGAPSADELSLMLRGFLIKLMALDSQLEETKAQSIPPWVPALSADTLRPSQTAGAVRNEPLLNVKAVETGVIDVSA
ncbi:DNA-binding protein [Papiliotrema laurentii]|uniref:DNA-binding protein n=1 Tax=Papiliotrema laurentii TaxID=5418 RepID=A0AAD9CU21_PAPLA|nr:DNA-binding protein [Papiliotrema laurentii]